MTLDPAGAQVEIIMQQILEVEKERCNCWKHARWQEMSVALTTYEASYARSIQSADLNHRHGKELMGCLTAVRLLAKRITLF